MIGVLMALASALFWATNDLISKKLLQKGWDEYLVLWVRFPVATLILTPLGILYWDLKENVFLYTFLWLPIEVLGGIFFMKGLKHAPLSVAMTFYSFMPFFTAVSSFLVLGETITFVGFVGVCLLVAGSLILTGFSVGDFFRKNIGSLYMLISTALFGFNVTLGKMVVLESNPFFFAWYYSLCMSLATLFFVRRNILSARTVWRNPVIFLLGFLFASGDLLYLYAYLYIPASYVAALERTSLLIAVLYGRIFFGEPIERVLPSSLLILSGSLLLALSVGG
ncbi:DMT family transporter [Thermocrinis albus]|nr:DMT family transporter [Thermocrinis albus]